MVPLEEIRTPFHGRGRRVGDEHGTAEVESRRSEWLERSRGSDPRVAKSPLRVVVVDDHDIVLEGLRSLVQRERGLQLVSSCQTGKEATRVIRELEPDVVVLDLSLPDMSGLDVLRGIENVDVSVVLFTASATQNEMLEAMRLGVRGVILKEMPTHLLVECIRKVGRGGKWLEKNSVGEILERLLTGAEAERNQMRQMTQREIEVIRLVCQGRRNRDIAEEMNLSVSTIKVHLHNIYGKLDIRSRTELMVWAREQGCQP